ncbi:hypothetical protein [Helicobacter sp. 11S02629-2]|nr:hypothetical protein [Helicobacter sp. 11S02629-2]
MTELIKVTLAAVGGFFLYKYTRKYLENKDKYDGIKDFITRDILEKD